MTIYPHNCFIHEPTNIECIKPHKKGECLNIGHPMHSKRKLDTPMKKCGYLLTNSVTTLKHDNSTHNCFIHEPTNIECTKPHKKREMP